MCHFVVEELHTRRTTTFFYNELGVHLDLSTEPCNSASDKLRRLLQFVDLGLGARLGGAIWLVVDRQCECTDFTFVRTITKGSILCS